MTSELVFVTGGTGFIGLHVVLRTLKANKRVRAAIRSPAGESRILNALARAGLPSDLAKNISFVVIPDILKDGAYDGQLEGVVEILHVASPLPQMSDDYQKTIVDPAVSGTLNILKAAKETSTVRRVVITSSIVMLVDMETLQDNQDKVYSEETKAKATGVDNPASAYYTSKVLAGEATRKFLEQYKYGEGRNFDVVTINPSYVLGTNYVLDSYGAGGDTGTNRLAWMIVQPLDGQPAQPLPQLSDSAVSVDDVADAHIKALTVEVKDKNKVEEFGVTAPNTGWGYVEGIVKKRFPEYTAQGVFDFKPTTGIKTNFDTSKAQNVLGIKFKSFEDAVVDVVSQNVELYLKQKKSA